MPDLFGFGFKNHEPRNSMLLLTMKATVTIWISRFMVHETKTHRVVPILHKLRHWPLVSFYVGPFRPQGTTRRRLAGHYYSLKSDFLREVLLTGLKKLFQLCYDVFFHPALFSQRAKGQRIFPIIFNLVWDSWLDMAGFLFRNEIAMKNWSFSGLSSLSDT